MEYQSQTSSWIGGRNYADAMADPSVAVPGSSVQPLRGARGVSVSVVQSVLGEVLQQYAATRGLGGSGSGSVGDWDWEERRGLQAAA